MHEDGQVKGISIDGRTFGGSSPCLIIAEVAQGHDGSLDLAHAFIEAAAAAGVDAVKFQTHIAHAESTRAEPWRVKFSHRDETRYEYWQRMEFSEEHWRGLSRHARELGLIFLSSPFSGEAVALLRRLGVPAWKIASGEILNPEVMSPVLASGLPILLSTGMSTLAEIDEAVSRIRKNGSPFLLFQCTSAYPTPPEKIGLNLIPFFRERYGCPVGLSDHSGGIYAGLAAAALGLDALEVHLTLSRRLPGPDVQSSLTCEEVQQLIKGMRDIERMRANPVDKDLLARELQSLRKMFTKSLAARVPLPAGTVIIREMLACKKPGTGIPAGKMDTVIGRRLRRALAADQFLDPGDFDSEAGHET